MFDDLRVDSLIVVEYHRTLYYTGMCLGLCPWKFARVKLRVPRASHVLLSCGNFAISATEKTTTWSMAAYFFWVAFRVLDLMAQRSHGDDTRESLSVLVMWENEQYHTPLMSWQL